MTGSIWDALLETLTSVVVTENRNRSGSYESERDPIEVTPIQCNYFFRYWHGRAG
jgi:hypothetical protein